MEDSQHLCPDCGADYVEAVVNDIASGAGADSRLMLASLEEGLAGLDAVPLPALGDTARKMLPALCAAALVFCLLAGVATGANIFYLLVAVALVPLAVSLLARMQGKLRLSAGEVVVRAAARVFAEDAASVRERFAGDAEVLARLDAMQLRLDDALARQASAHAQNRRKVTVIAAVVLICCSAGAGSSGDGRRFAGRMRRTQSDILPFYNDKTPVCFYEVCHDNGRKNCHSYGRIQMDYE